MCVMTILSLGKRIATSSSNKGSERAILNFGAKPACGFGPPNPVWKNPECHIAAQVQIEENMLGHSEDALRREAQVRQLPSTCQLSIRTRTWQLFQACRRTSDCMQLESDWDTAL